MKLDNIYRVDYPIYDPDAADGAQPIGPDIDVAVESQPLGLLFQFSSLSNGLFVYIDDDAEQIRYEVRKVADVITYASNYFGFISLISKQSNLQKSIGSELQQVCLGLADGSNTSNKLLFGIRLQFETNTLVFLNYGDEGCYFLEGSEKYTEFFAAYSKVFTGIVWQEQPQILAQIAA